MRDDKGREKERYQVVYGAKVLFADGAKVKANSVLLEWDPYTFSILTVTTSKPSAIFPRRSRSK